MASSYEIIVLLNALILADRSVTIEDISELEVSMDKAHKIPHVDFFYVHFSLGFTRTMQGLILQ